MVHNSKYPFAAAACLIAFCGTAPAQQMAPSTPVTGGMPPAAARLGQGTSNPPRATGLSVVPPDFARLRLGPGFLVNLNVLDDPDFAGNFRIDDKGDLALPVLGAVHVDGETATEAQSQIQKLLRDGQILKEPQVNLTVVEYAATEVTILGEVGAPGRYPLLAPRALSDVLGLAGGLTIAAGNEIEITHGGTDLNPQMIHFSKATHMKAVEDTIVRPGDTVQIKRAGIVYVLGAVARPGGYIMQEDGTFTALEAISAANGTTVPAAVGTIYLLRRNPDGTAIRISLPLSKMQRGKSSDIQLHATDIVYVPTSKIKSVFLNTQGILTAATSAAIYATAVY